MLVLSLSAPAEAIEPQPITLDESKLFVAPNTSLQRFSQTINLKKGQDKLNLTLTYYDCTETAPSFKVLRITSPTMNFLTEQQFAGRKVINIDATGDLTWGGLQLMIQAEGPAGAAFGWRVTTPQPTVTSVYPDSAGPGETVTITGTNFCPDATANVVLIDGKPATCIDANRKRIVVRLPEELPGGNISGTVQVAGINAGSFSLAVDAVPVITGLGNDVSPTSGSAGYCPPGNPMTILGRNFSPTPNAMKVTIGPFTCDVQRCTVDSVTVEAPVGFSGAPWGIHQPVKIWVNGVQARGQLFVSIYNPVGNF